MTLETLERIEELLIYFLGVQVIFSILVFLLGRIILDVLKISFWRFFYN
jgi:hypothetical protein